MCDRQRDQREWHVRLAHNRQTACELSLSYDATRAYLNLQLDFAMPGGLNGNQQLAGDALANYLNDNGIVQLTGRDGQQR